MNPKRVLTAAENKAALHERDVIVAALKRWAHNGALDAKATWKAIARGEHHE